MSWMKNIKITKYKCFFHFYHFFEKLKNIWPLPKDKGKYLSSSISLIVIIGFSNKLINSSIESSISLSIFKTLSFIFLRISIILVSLKSILFFSIVLTILINSLHNEDNSSLS